MVSQPAFLGTALNSFDTGWPEVQYSGLNELHVLVKFLMVEIMLGSTSISILKIFLITGPKTTIGASNSSWVIHM